MRFRTTLVDTEAPAFFDRFIDITGPDIWHKRYRVLTDQTRVNVFLQDFVVRRHGVELSIGRLLEERENRPTVSVDVALDANYAAFSFIASVVQIYDSVNKTGKTRLAGTLRDGLNTDRGLRPFQTEIEVATHLVQVGFDLTFHDLEGASGFDFLASRNDIEIEVECKSVSGDLGRQVHERRMADLSHRIVRSLNDQTSSLSGGQLVRVTLPARLPADPRALDSVAANVRAAISGAVPPFPEACNAEVHIFALDKSPFSALDPHQVTREATRKFVDEQLGPSNVSAFVLFAPGKHALVVVVDSYKRDRVVAELLRDLKDGAD